MPNFGKLALSVAKKQLKGHRTLPYQLPTMTLFKSGIQFNMEHVEKYCDVCGFSNASSIPIIYPAMVCRDLQVKLMVEDDFPFPVMGLVHLANKIEQYSVITPNDKLSLKVSLGPDLVLHDKGYCCDLLCEFTSEDTGKLVWRNTFTLFHLNKRDKRYDDPNTLYDSFIKESDLIGAVEVSQWQVPSNKGREYAVVSGDFNPIHLHPASAYLFGFTKGAIMHGMWTKARAIAEIMPPVEQMAMPPLSASGEVQPLSEVYVEFKTPLYLPSAATLSCRSPQQNEDDINDLVRKEERIFEVKGAGGDKLPHMRGRCWWYEDVVNTNK